jgi:hypothetical protein
MQKPGNTTSPSLQPIWWKVILGGALILVGIGYMFLRPVPLSEQVIGAAFLLLGVWIAYAGSHPLMATGRGDRRAVPGESSLGKQPIFMRRPDAVRNAHTGKASLAK